MPNVPHDFPRRALAETAEGHVERNRVRQEALEARKVDKEKDTYLAAEAGATLSSADEVLLSELFIFICLRVRSEEVAKAERSTREQTYI